MNKTVLCFPAFECSAYIVQVYSLQLGGRQLEVAFLGFCFMIPDSSTSSPTVHSLPHAIQGKGKGKRGFV